MFSELHNLFSQRHESRRPRTWQPSLEQLDERLVPAATSAFSGSILTVNCDGANDTVNITRNATGSILVNGQLVVTSSRTPSGVPVLVAATITNTQEIVVHGGGGDDTITVDLPGYTGIDRLFGEGGNDRLLGGPGPSFLSGGSGRNGLDGRAGTNTLIEQFDAYRVVLTSTNLFIDGLPGGASAVHGLTNIQTADLRHVGSRPVTINAREWQGSDGIRLEGGSGNDILWGPRYRRSTLVGHDGNDILIGGRGADGLLAGENDDILISGWTNYDENEAALVALRGIWTGPGSFAQRRDAIRSDGNGTGYWLGDQRGIRTVWNESSTPRDQLYGSTGSDLFYTRVAGDEWVFPYYIPPFVPGSQDDFNGRTDPFSDNGEDGYFNVNWYA